MDVTTGTMISSVASTLGVVIVAWLAFRTAKLSKAVEEVRHNTNSLTEKLIAKTEIISEAKGNAEGREELKHEQAQWGAQPPVIKPP